MQWSKLKNIVLLILILTNLCLLAFVLRQEAQSRAGERQTLSSTLAFLAQKGVHVQANQLPDPKSLAPLTAQRDLESEYAAAAALRKKDVLTVEAGAKRRLQDKTHRLAELDCPAEEAEAEAERRERKSIAASTPTAPCSSTATAPSPPS